MAKEQVQLNPPTGEKKSLYNGLYYGTSSCTFHDAQGNQIGLATFLAEKGGNFLARGRIFDSAGKYFASMGLNGNFGRFGIGEQNKGIEYSGGRVMTDGNIYYYPRENPPPPPWGDRADNTGQLSDSAKKKAEQYRIGYAVVENGVGIVYNKEGAKVGEVRDAGDFAISYAGAVFACLMKK